MLRIAICDDEQEFIQILEKIIVEYMTFKQIEGKIDLFYSSEEILNIGNKLEQYDIFFLDINMSNIDGIDAATRIRKKCRKSFIVFVTAYVKYSLEGYKVNAIRYLLKGTNNFVPTVYECMDAIVEQMQYGSKVITFDFYEGTQAVYVDDIIYIEAFSHTLFFHINGADEKNFSIASTLNKVEAILKDYSFTRVHKSFLINMMYVKKICNYKAFLSDGTVIPIPHTKYGIIKETFIKSKGSL